MAEPGPSMPAPPEMPADLPVATPPAGWQRIDFLSDLHLAADMPRTFAAWADHMRQTPADEVWILGDLFEVWVGDDQRQRAFEQGCVQVLADAARRRPLHFIAGNRDFLLGAQMAVDAGLHCHPDPSVLQAGAQRLLLSHGDALCLADTDYQQFRALARSAAWQRDFLALPLDERLRQASAARAASDARRQALGHAHELWADVDTAAALAWLRAADCQDLVHGHTHRPGTNTLAPGHRRHVLSDWDLDSGSAPPRAEVLCLTRAGWQRLSPSVATPAA